MHTSSNVVQSRHGHLEGARVTHLLWGGVVCGLLLWEDTKKLQRKRNMKTAHFWANQKTHQVLFYVCQQRQLRKVKHEDKTVSSYYFL